MHAKTLFSAAPPVLMLVALLAACSEFQDPLEVERLDAPAPQFSFTGAATYTQLSAGADHTCALKNDGSIVCWGRNDFGQATAPAGTNFVEVSAGDYHTCARMIGGTLACWGYNEFDQSSAPQGNAFNQVSGGFYHSCARKSDGSVLCWGINAHGRLNAPPETEFVDISAGGNFTCGVTSSSSVVCWGSDGDGQQNAPAGSDLVEVSAGLFHACARRTNGEIACWGNNWNGQSNPPSGTGFIQVSAGAFHNCALTSDGSIVCWGSNLRGQGNAPSGSGFTEVAAGQNHTCARMGDGLLTCWGDDFLGQLQFPPDQPDHPQTITFTTTPPVPAQVGDTYQVGASTGSGLPATFGSLTPAICSVSGSIASLIAAGTCTITADQSGNAFYLPALQATQSFAIAVGYVFGGFQRPVEDLPIWNGANAGQVIPLRFTLGGDYGLGILGSNSPSSITVACQVGEPVLVDEAASQAPGGNALTYDAVTDTYTYVWKTQKSWKNTCRQLVLTLSDGSTHRANFRFK